MKHHLQFNRILLVTMMTICVTQGTLVQKLYRKLEPGEDIVVGVVIAEHKRVSSTQCSIRCLGDNRCAVYHYRGTKLGNCLLIHKNCSDEGGKIFEDDGYGETYQKVGRSGWSEPDAVLYQSFDSPDGLVLMEGSEPMSPVPLVPGLIHCSLTLNKTRKQWVDLGIHTDVCMTRPETCGAAGDAISVWVHYASGSGTIIATISSFIETGFQIYCSNDVLQFRIFLLDGYFQAAHTRPTGWTHIVLNYIGPSDDEGIRIYYDGAEVANDMTKSVARFNPADGGILVAKRGDGDSGYTSLELDELIFFNKTLRTADITAMYNGV